MQEKNPIGSTPSNPEKQPGKTPGSAQDFPGKAPDVYATGKPSEGQPSQGQAGQRDQAGQNPRDHAGQSQRDQAKTATGGAQPGNTGNKGDAIRQGTPNQGDTSRRS